MVSRNLAVRTKTYTHVRRLARLGSISPIGRLAAYVTIDTLEWELYDGFNGDMHVYTFVAPQPVYSVETDIKLFFDYLTSYYSFPDDAQYLLSESSPIRPLSSNLNSVSDASRHRAIYGGPCYFCDASLLGNGRIEHKCVSR